ncbi:hypothetical protein SAMN04488581_2632 [Mycolicibacterium neoaurum]|uniref:hypothetical protein n=1 Tax=Mycolicibacterium neoaurum TaxID=1795 RepID=UPI0005669C4F|nr:hypothetical protein [Mycolicibacterium neoaurum]SDD59998.1 hypothetical protein SAMN04488581_2632 [Mycolicibacterium neoaurum]
MRIYGIYWTRDGIEPGERIEAGEVDWKIDADFTEVRREFDSRDDKYWPSVLFSADVRNMTLVEEGSCPPHLVKGVGRG